ncbi:hypothetical protein NE865_03643 [Phthorimaea operculella]|nr:hypothetical protein NE865_03643 [Phthorimaea operculella]
MDGLDKNMKFISFNCKGLKRSMDQIRILCKQYHLVALQETWLFPHDLDVLNTIDPAFGSYGVSAIDTTQGVVRGRPYGGVALLWDKRAFPCAEIVPCHNNRMVALKLSRGDRSILVFSVYMPTDCADNLPEFTQCLGNISAIIDSVDIEAVYALGDYNAQPGTRFGKELVDFCIEQSLSCVDFDRLGMDSDVITFVSEAHGTGSWLDHCITTAAAASTVIGVSVLCDVYVSDHYPLLIELELNSIRPKTSCNNNDLNLKYIWGNRDKDQTDLYIL